MDRERFAAFVHSFDQLCIDIYGLPKPTVAAITGHATAGGCILALGADHRIIGSGRRLMGLNEVKLGVTVPFPADRMLRAMVDGRTARAVVEQGEFYPPDELLEMGLVDEVVDPEQVIPSAVQMATSMAAMPPQAYAALKDIRTRPVLEEILTGLAARQAEFVDLWYNPHAREQLDEAMQRF
jgi:enoyl-CoA hydratase/carnithine racemase